MQECVGPIALWTVRAGSEVDLVMCKETARQYVKVKGSQIGNKGD